MVFEKMNFPKIKLAHLPTPLVPLDRLSDHFKGPRIWMKRDDLTGLGMGGNKSRKLEYLVAEAEQQGADTLVTAGATQSNHCRQTAAAAAARGLKCHLILGDESTRPEGNYLLDLLFGAQIHWGHGARKGEDLEDLVAELNQKGQKAYLIPYGGSNAMGALGFVSAYEEILAQARQMNLAMDSIVFPSSSGGTHAGLIVGNSLQGSQTEILGIGIDKSPLGEPTIREKVEQITKDTAAMINFDGSLSSINLNESFMGRPYGDCGDLESNAIHTVAKLEGILLDPVYTGRAMGGFLNLLKADYFNGKENLVFWHTGGTPAVFAYSNQLS